MFPQDKEAGVSFLELLTAEAWVQHLNLNLSDSVWNEATRNPEKEKILKNTVSRKHHGYVIFG